MKDRLCAFAVFLLIGVPAGMLIGHWIDQHVRSKHAAPAPKPQPPANADIISAVDRWAAQERIDRKWDMPWMTISTAESVQRVSYSDEVKAVVLLKEEYADGSKGRMLIEARFRPIPLSGGETEWVLERTFTTIVKRERFKKPPLPGPGPCPKCPKTMPKCDEDK